jgi:D-beta-D-heptose 7-phosphate kinase/D-beta-D-heptose 1-phosphate adenosyltransferase
MRKPEIIDEKIVEIKKLLQKIMVWRLQNYSIVFTNGCFDILHKGHAWLLNKSSALEDKTILIVGLNSDDSVKRLKGENRPVNNLHDRSYIISSLYAVDAVIVFEEDTPYEIIKMIKPDILVKGGDYKENEIAGADIVKTNGGRIEILPLLENYSTTQTIKKLK